MPYKLPDGRLLSPDRAFIFGDVQYPANWLRLSTQEDRDALGIVWVEPDPVWDQRFYWGYDADGQLIPKDHAQLVEQWVAQTKTTANTLLAPSDWMITRSAEPGGKPASDEVLAQRAAIRAKSDEKEAAIAGTTSTDELAAYVTSSAYAAWSDLEPSPEVIAVENTTEYTLSAEAAPSIPSSLP